MVSNANEDLPEPDRPVMTVSVSRGISTSTFFRLCSRAPRTEMFFSMTCNPNVQFRRGGPLPQPRICRPLPGWLFAVKLTHDTNNLLAAPGTALIGPIVASIWWGIPFFAITNLAALQSIPKDLYEAAAIDGASVFKQFRSITLPLLAPTLAITVLLRTIWVANFADLIVVMTNGGPADSTQTVASYIFTVAFRRLDFGYASSIAAVLLTLLFVYVLAILSLRRLFVRRQN